MLRWFVFTIAMGLLPFGFSVLLQALRGVPPHEWQSSPELLFFGVIVGASQLDGILAALSSGSESMKAWRTFVSAMFGWFLLSAIVSAALYGVYVDQVRSDPARILGSACAVVKQVPAAADAVAIDDKCTEWLDFQENLFRFSIWMAVTAALLGTTTEWICTRRQR
jgi:hypothetical protein